MKEHKDNITDRIFCTLYHPNMVTILSADQDIYSEKFNAELSKVYQVNHYYTDKGRSWSLMLSDAHITDLKIKKADLETLAIKFLTANYLNKSKIHIECITSKKAKIDKIKLDYQCSDGLMLCTDYWKALAKNYDSNLYLTFPMASVLLISNGSVENKDLLMKESSKIHTQPGNSNAIFKWSGDKWLIDGHFS